MGNLVATAQPDELENISSRPRLHVESLQTQKKKVLFVTPEFTDLVKVGGLGDVSSALPRALDAHHDIRLLIPGYREVMDSGIPIRIVGKVDGHAALPPCRIGRMDLDDGVIVYIVICPELYERDGTPYSDSQGNDWPDNHIRFARLGLTAAEIAAGNASISWSPELVHANDWPSSLAPAFMAWRKLRTPSVMTVHNLCYQGLFDAACMPELGLPAEQFTPEGFEYYGQISFLKAGLTCANHITAVSRTYAREITEEEHGCGLDGLLRKRAEENQLTGIPNGIDHTWDPANDPHLLCGFREGEWDGKREHARYVEETFGLEQDDGPLFAVVSRLVHQKGIDLTIAIADELVEAGGRMAVIGRGEPKLEEAMRQLALRHPGRIGVNVGFNETDARRMFAGSDFLLMPSRFEPCGLSQMYAQRFGSLPIARRTGGLADTIEDGVTGFLFSEPTEASYLEAVMRAVNVHRHPELLNAMRRKAMGSPLYWQESVKPYDELYQRLLNDKVPATLAREVGRR
ncbi:starch synthase [Halopseudomonas xinjiangensis]|uniref:Glycogen synthase n=1 Tax=Halopseudomonas xinjiangensis TaxID=487184 RepID=A0A1H1VAB9_9GAMM|nr:glycogen synthase GlgA [Halopseudomonas xinjiangensis]SDS81580.1 starch synthase [Halopseudomonas xinjiangensis]